MTGDLLSSFYIFRMFYTKRKKYIEGRCTKKIKTEEIEDVALKNTYITKKPLLETNLLKLQ